MITRMNRSLLLTLVLLLVFLMISSVTYSGIPISGEISINEITGLPFYLSDAERPKKGLR